MIAAAPMDAPAPALLARAAGAAARTLSAPAELAPGDTLVVSSGRWPEADVRAALARGPGRVLVLGRLGTHRDARARALRALWAIEELARGSGVPTLALRLGPVVAPELPLWRRLARCGRLPRGGTKLVNPVTLADAIETLRRAFAIEAAWEGWYEVAGAEAWSLAELAAAARDTASAGPAAWEPPLAELLEHRLAECDPWLERFRLTPHALSHEVRGWRRAA